MADFFNKKRFDSQMRRLAAGYKKRYGDLLDGYDVEAEIAESDEYREKLRAFVIDALPLIKSAEQQENTKILVEGANALMLDLDWGTYPYVWPLSPFPPTARSFRHVSSILEYVRKHNPNLP